MVSYAKTKILACDNIVCPKNTTCVGGKQFCLDHSCYDVNVCSNSSSAAFEAYSELLGPNMDLSFYGIGNSFVVYPSKYAIAKILIFL